MDSTATLKIAESPKQRCPKGHETETVNVSYHVGGGKLVAQRPYCVVCWIEWMGDTFPVEPVPPGEPRRCKVCDAPEQDGAIEHSKACYQVSPDGGGTESLD